MSTSAMEHPVLARRLLFKPQTKYHRKEWRKLSVQLEGASADLFPDADPGRFEEFRRQVHSFAHYPTGLTVALVAWAVGLLAMYALGTRGIVLFFAIVLIGSIGGVRLNQITQRKLLNLGEHLGVFAHRHGRHHQPAGH